MVAAQPFFELGGEVLLGRQQAELGTVLGASGAHLRTEQQAAGNPRELLERRRITHFDADELQAGLLGARGASDWTVERNTR